MTDTIRDRAYDAIPGYADSQKILDNAFMITHPRSDALKEATLRLQQQVREHVLAGEDIPLELAEAVIDAEREQHTAELAAAALDDVIRIARANLEHIKDGVNIESFTVLNSELDTLVDKVRALILKLDGATTANEALSAGNTASDAWRELITLADQYDEIRTVQKDLIPKGTLNFWPMLTSTGLYRDALTVSAGFRKFAGLPAGAQLAAEYSWWPADIDRPGALLRIVQNTDPWVPDPSTMEAAFNAAYTALREVDTSTPMGAELAAERQAAYDKITSR